MLTLRHKGQGLVEYAFILMLVAVVVVVVVALLGPVVGNMYSQIVVQI
ncbi:MAG TPA: pilus assembly protein [Anaerolineales bacterium]|nr:pilus assembly protein [Anaerolineales bacterium]HRF48045.1 pilus assembly protein [Anaerolineales bacterium]